MITTRTPITGKGGDIAVALNYASRHADRADDAQDYAAELYRLCGLVGFNADVLFAQAAHETDGFTSYWWRERLNPAGIGITGDPAQNEASQKWNSGVGAARAHVAHMLAYVFGGGWVRTGFSTPPWPWDDDARFNLVLTGPTGGKVKTIADLTGKWAIDPKYAEKIAVKANAIFKDVSPMPTIVAEPCPIEIRVLTGPMVNRPAIPMPDASFVTVHEVGNLSPGADEDMHANFVHNGGGENAVSFHLVVGPTKAIQLVYLNENAWHASDGFYGRGNRDTIAIETIQIGDFGRTLSHLAWVIAELYRNPWRFKYRTDVAVTDDLAPALVMERTKQHNFWAPDKKNCPQFIRDRGLWLPLLNAVQNELAADVPEVKKYATPILPEWWSEKAVFDLRSHREDGVLYKPLGSRITAIKETGAYAHPWLPEGKGKRTRANIQKGETVDLRFVANHPKTKDQWGITRYGTWVALKNFSPRFTVRNVSQEG